MAFTTTGHQKQSEATNTAKSGVDPVVKAQFEKSEAQIDEYLKFLNDPKAFFNREIQNPLQRLFC
ncbi:hypothetical protein E2K73_09175 [Acinetobacter sp. RF15A]|uniref:hypothetical protein n=1 Tax=unclassified Acinetobacter TaxID=196816 RepID=UPI001192AED3|nr:MULTISPECIES: hypothetical protein [unclassified Acinetobacter]TSH73986.1 hypothetical protein E2K73_09175 [Acinetobacter sp. RF15A]TSI20371.1 hypothetical protein E2K74_02740 [Acinetobacter sp. RF15B]